MEFTLEAHSCQQSQNSVLLPGTLELGSSMNRLRDMMLCNLSTYSTSSYSTKQELYFEVAKLQQAFT